MRKSALILLVVLLAHVAVFWFFFQDHYLESALESAIEIVAGAKVEIDDFHLSLWGLECSWERLQIANKNDPWKNLLETGSASFKLEGRPLFWKRLIIHKMVLEDVRSGTQRTSDGSLPQPEPDEEPGLVDKKAAELQQKIRQMPVFDLEALGTKIKIDSIVDVNNLQAVQQYQELAQWADSSFKYWEAQLQPEAYRKQLNTLGTEIQALQLDKISNVVELASALKKLEDIHTRVKKLKSEVDAQYQGVRQLTNDADQLLNLAQDAVKRDIARAQELARLKDLDVREVALLLFGAPVMRQFDQISGYIQLGRKYLPTAKKLLISEKEEKPPRFEGQDIYFPFHYRYPRFLLRKARFSGATAAGDTSRAYFVNGTLTGLTNEPPVFGKPTRFDLSSAKQQGNQYQIMGVLDHRTEESRDSLWIKSANWGMGKVKLAKSNYFPTEMRSQKGSLDLSAFFIEKRREISLKAVAAPVSFSFGESKGRIAQIVREVLSALNRLEIDASLRSGDGSRDLRLNSNIDDVLSRKIRSLLDEKIQQARQQVEEYVRAEVQKQRLKAEKRVNDIKENLMAEADTLKERVHNRLNEVEKRKKEVKARIAAEKEKAEQKKKELEDKAKDKLNNLLNRPKNP